MAAPSAGIAAHAGSGPHGLLRRPDDVRHKFEAFGEIRDVYLPLDYYTK